MMYGIAAFFIGNQLHNALLSTGAFEIYINDVLAFSKIATGTMPDANTLN
jgi:predicted Rdx family selenoprotein